MQRIENRPFFLIMGLLFISNVFVAIGDDGNSESKSTIHQTLLESNSDAFNDQSLEFLHVPQKRKLKILIVTKLFPSRPQVMIVNQIAGLLELGHDQFKFVPSIFILRHLNHNGILLGLEPCHVNFQLPVPDSTTNYDAN